MTTTNSFAAGATRCMSSWHFSPGLVLGTQMMTFTQHPYMLLSSKALPLWIALLSPRDSLAKQESQGPTPPHTLLPMECVSALLDLAGALPCSPQSPDSLHSAEAALVIMRMESCIALN